jgi:hypothetical protein
MDLFELNEKGEITILPEAREIPELKILIDRDTSKDKKRFTKEIQYIWHLYNSKSPYEAYGVTPQREQMIIKDFIKESKWTADADIKAFCIRYQSFLDSPAKRLLKASRAAVDEIATFLGSKECDIDTKAKLMEKVPKIIEGLDKCEERVKKEITTTEKLRGGGAAKGRER